jgi:hypothetical protein
VRLGEGDLAADLLGAGLEVAHEEEDLGQVEALLAEHLCRAERP